MTCEHMHYLSRINNFRWAAICEHGTIHLSWDHLMLFITPGELDKLGMTIDAAITHNQHFKKYREALEDETQHWSVPEKGFFNIWVGRYALRLAPVDYLLFGSMVNKATDNLMPEMLTGKSCLVEMWVEERIESKTKIQQASAFKFSQN